MYYTEASSYYPHLYSVNVNPSINRFFLLGYTFFYVLIFSMNFSFTVCEMKRIYRGFKTECPTGLITEEAFQGIYSRFFPHGGTILLDTRVLNLL